MVVQGCPGMCRLVLACGGMVLACVGMWKDVQRCAKLFSQFGQKNQPGMSTPVGRVLRVQAACAQRRIHAGSKLPVAPVVPCIPHAVRNGTSAARLTSPKRKRGKVFGPSLALRASVTASRVRYIAGRRQIAGNDGAVHAGLVDDLLLGESGEIRLHRRLSPFGQHCAIPSFFGRGRTPIWVAA